MSRDFAYKAAAAALVSLASAQQLGTTPDAHPPLTTWKCTTGGGCVEQATSIVIDWNWHWLRDANYNSCTTSSGLNQTLCGTEQACGTNCYVEGVSNYTAQGVSTSGSSLTMTQNVLNNGVYQNSSPRVYLLAPDGENYEGLKLLGQEISFDVDASTLVCGENGAFYLSEMDLSGGRSQYNPGGAAYGAGYCDAQCPTGTWFNGSVNTNNYGACCNEMDLWEANANATALTPHPCNVTSVGACTGTECGSSGDCDKNGCGFNPYALGQQSYYGAGAGFTVDTLKPVTVTTQFITDDGTTTGTLIEIRRQYIQDGVVINNAVASSTSGWTGQDSITESFCEATSPEGKRLGALKTMGEALGRGMVLVASVWNDAGGYMNWLDSGNAGPCSATEGNPTVINQNTPYTGVSIYSPLFILPMTNITCRQPSPTSSGATLARPPTAKHHRHHQALPPLLPPAPPPAPSHHQAPVSPPRHLSAHKASV